MGSSQCLCARRVTRCRIRDKTEVLVNFSPILFYSSGLIWIFGFVISTERNEAFTAVQAHNCPTITSIGYVGDIAYNKDNYCTTSTTLNFPTNTFEMSISQEVLLRLLKATQKSHFWFTWKGWIFHNHLV